jgi:hypothetical protein
MSSREKEHRDARCENQCPPTKQSRWQAAAELRAGKSAAYRALPYEKRFRPADRAPSNKQKCGGQVGCADQQRPRRMQGADFNILEEPPKGQHHDPDRSAEIATINTQYELEKKNRSGRQMTPPADGFSKPPSETQGECGCQQQPWKGEIEGLGWGP